MATGDVINWPDVAVRLATTSLTSDSSTWSNTESGALATVTIAAVSGYVYKIWFTGKVSADVAADASNMRIREDNSTGTQVVLQQIYLPTTSGNGFQAHLYGEWTASSTASKSFVVTGQRSIGTGTAHRIRASGSAPCFLIAERIVS